eukprot:TRINITY_DN23284_c0_g1_i1.p1 TRINITY_DN23284_c0_g1~~TRINITY_DN23284_c0_g1_i1.p1  ORF type:complete len:405 (+),score=65.89 TRINITY_DN23284_c0_g1_i1:58-1272(+)
MSMLSVNGLVDIRDDLWCLSGEYLLHDHTEEGDGIGVGDVTMKELQKLRENPRARSENMRCVSSNNNDVSMLRADLEELPNNSNCVMVDLTTSHSEADITTLQSLSKQTGVCIIASSGGYLQKLFSTKLVKSPDFSFNLDICGVITCGLASLDLLEWSTQVSYLNKCLQTASDHERGVVPVNIVFPVSSEMLFQKCLEAIIDHKKNIDSLSRPFPSVIFHGIDVEICLRLGLPDYCFISCDFFSWGSLLLPGGKHPFGYNLPSIQLVESLIAKYPNQVLFGTLHCLKICSTSWGGPGRSAMLRAMMAHNISLPGSASLKHLAWYTPPPPKEVEIIYWRCDNCEQSFEEKTPDDSFRKYTFRFCSIKCMRDHTPVQSEQQKDRQQQKKRATGSGLASWGVSCPSR